MLFILIVGFDLCGYSACYFVYLLVLFCLVACCFAYDLRLLLVCLGLVYVVDCSLFGEFDLWCVYLMGVG